MLHEKPLCFVSPKVFALWLDQKGGEKCTNPCVDCLPQYQMRMKKRGLCAHPETMFSVDKDGGIYGYWPEAA